MPMIKLLIWWKYGYKYNLCVCILGKIKDIISSKIGVPPEVQELKGWKRVKGTDSVLISYSINTKIA
jgi:hypothetical protein